MGSPGDNEPDKTLRFQVAARQAPGLAPPEPDLAKPEHQGSTVDDSAVSPSKGPTRVARRHLRVVGPHRPTILSRGLLITAALVGAAVFGLTTYLGIGADGPQQPNVSRRGTEDRVLGTRIAAGSLVDAPRADQMPRTMPHVTRSHASPSTHRIHSVRVAVAVQSPRVDVAPSAEATENGKHLGTRPHQRSHDKKHRGGG
ncbi:MAG: hypothetical protein QOH90_220, partial [Actinomycetota bacterium]|nr:hypothetical protein [Actinomycetota bacterium]